MNDPTGQKGPAKIEVQVDVIDCPATEGGDPVRWRVLELLEQDAGMWALRCAQ